MSATAATARVRVLGCPIDALDMDATLARCTALIESGGFAQHMAVNAAKLVAMRDDERLRRIIEDCHLISADGQSVVWASRLLGTPVPERVAGIDLMMGLLAEAERCGYRVYVLGARRDVLEQAIARIRERHPNLRFAGWRDGYFEPQETSEVCDDIRTSGADILLVAMSTPRKEIFLGDHGLELGVPFVMGVGGAIDVVAGVTRRAPGAWQRLGLEWLYRLLQEPRRMFRRYAVTNARFLWLLAAALMTGRGGDGRSA